MLTFQQIFNKSKSKRKLKKLWTDEGTEFYNKAFMNFLKKITALHYTVPLMKEKRLLLSTLKETI